MNNIPALLRGIANDLEMDAPSEVLVLAASDLYRCAEYLETHGWWSMADPDYPDDEGGPISH